MLGYDVVDKRLIVNAAEADQVRAIFSIYLSGQGILGVVRELVARGLRNKTWMNKRDESISGGPFSKTTVHSLLTNPLYVGKIRAGDDLVDGVHEAIVDQETWDCVQARLHKDQ